MVSCSFHGVGHWWSGSQLTMPRLKYLFGQVGIRAYARAARRCNCVAAVLRRPLSGHHPGSRRARHVHIRQIGLHLTRDATKTHVDDTAAWSSLSDLDTNTIILRITDAIETNLKNAPRPERRSLHPTKISGVEISGAESQYLRLLEAKMDWSPKSGFDNLYNRFSW